MLKILKMTQNVILKCKGSNYAYIKNGDLLYISPLKVIYKGCFKSFVALYADRICSDQHFVENRIEKFLFV